MGEEKMRGLAVAVLGALLLAAPARAFADASSDLHALITDYEHFSREADPIRAAFRGDVAAQVRWPDDAPAAVAARTRQLHEFSSRLAALATQQLSETEGIERDALQSRVSGALEGAAFDEERMPFISGEGFFTNPDYAATLTVLSTVEDAERWLTRLAAIPAYYETEIGNMRRGIQTGFTQPRLVVMNSLRGVRAQAALPAQQSPLLRPLTALPSTIPETQRANLYARGEEIYRTRVIPSLTALGDFLEHEYLPHARVAIGISSLPNGARYYAYLARKHTTTDLTPAQIHALGLREVARIRTEMDAAIRQTGFHGSFAEFLAFLRSDPQFYPHDADDLMRISSEIYNRINFQLPHYFGVLPRNTYAITFIPSALETGSSGYWPGNPQQGVAGQVLLRHSDAEHRTLYDLPAWILHEGAPGHHIQIALAEEQQSLPEYRRNDDITAFVEGWALYSERLGEEMGIYRTPYEHFGRLSMEMWRACRLVIDTGIHAMGWTREQAVACLGDNSALAPAEIEREVDRYIGWPGQALAYKIGEIQIRDLRAQAEQRLGACFDIRRFHDAVLGSGPLPMSVLQRRMQNWTAAQACPHS
jgi:uncharacterized protein (DUF885 family)